MRNLARLAVVVLTLLSTSVLVIAQDWTVVRLRGDAQHYDGREWHPLAIGDTVRRSHHVRTLHNGRMELVRGNESIDLGPGTFLAIHEAQGRKLTNVEHHLGSVVISADKRNVEHFQVTTPVLAAVVKGTRFSVRLANGRALVDVDSGVVQVQDTSNNVIANVVVGQSASAGADRPLQVSGPGSSNTVYLVNGQAVVGANAAAQAAGFDPAPDPGSTFQSLAQGGGQQVRRSRCVPAAVKRR